MDTLSALQSQQLDLQTSKLYFGGLPPSFDFYKFPNIETQSLLGSLRGITTSNPGSNSLMNPLYTEYGIINPFYGVIPSCENKILKVASFTGKGHMEMKSQSLRKDSNFGFTFKTTQQDAVLAISTFLGKSSADSSDFYSVSLSAGHVTLVLGSDQKTTYVTDKTYNDGQQHTILVIKRSRKLSIYIDGRMVQNLPPWAQLSL